MDIRPAWALLNSLEQMSEGPAVSVVIHFLDAERHLADAVRSVRWQTFTDWELVLVDGGSMDASVAIGRGLVREDPARIRLLEHHGPERLGIYSSRIWGAREARAALLAHLDSDDEWHPQFLERQHAVHRARFADRPGLTYSPMVYWWEEPSRALDSYVQPVPKAGVHEPPSLVVPFTQNFYEVTPGNSAVMVDREIILESATLIGTADEGMGDDQFLWSYVALNYPICVQPEPLARYRQWSGSTCAKGVASGEHVAARQRHKAWLTAYVRSNCSGLAKDEMLAALHQSEGR